MASQPTSASDDSSAADLIVLTADIVAAHVSNNSVPPDQIPSLIQTIHQALTGLGQAQEEPRPEPAVSVRSSVKSDHVVCLEDGKKMKMLKRHLMTDHGLTPDEYRARWDLPASYPMVAPGYSETRRNLAKKIGLGRKKGQKPGNKASPKPKAKKAAAPRKARGASNGNGGSSK